MLAAVLFLPVGAGAVSARRAYALDAVSGRIEESDTTHRYQFYSDRVKIYQDDTMTWGAFYLECPTGVYESAMAGVFEDGSAWYQLKVGRAVKPARLSGRGSLAQSAI